MKKKNYGPELRDESTHYNDVLPLVYINVLKNAIHSLIRLWTEE